MGLRASAELLHDARQFNNGLVTKYEASGASVRKDVEVQLLSDAPTKTSSHALVVVLVWPHFDVRSTAAIRSHNRRNGHSGSGSRAPRTGLAKMAPRQSRLPGGRRHLPGGKRARVLFGRYAQRRDRIHGLLRRSSVGGDYARRPASRVEYLGSSALGQRLTLSPLYLDIRLAKRVD